MSGGRFASLRNGSWYSLHEGVASPQALLERAAQCGYEALAITDHNSLAGAVEFAEVARQIGGVRPLFGARLSAKSQRATALIADTGGWSSLCRILSRLHLQSGAALPQLLASCPDGLQLLVDDAAMLKPPLTDVFKGRLWAEVVRPGRSDAHERGLIQAASAVGVKPVASLGTCLGVREDYAVYRLLAAIKQGVTLDQLPGTLTVTPDHHLADLDTVAHRFRDLPDAMANTMRLAAQCRSDVLPRGIVAPPNKAPGGQDALAYLQLLAERNLPQLSIRDEGVLRRRLTEELALVGQHELAAYFLAVAELTSEAKRRGWPFSLRGSAGGSVLCYLLGITDIDPTRYGLRLERFLHASRQDPPDIDLDFAPQYRAPLLQWAAKHFGGQHICRVGSWHHYRGTSAFKTAAQAHGLSSDQIRTVYDEVAKDVKQFGTDESPDLLAAVPTSWPGDRVGWPRMMAHARSLLGRPSKLDGHPTGVVLTARPCEDYSPLQRYGSVVAGVTQLDAPACESIGLTKLDILSSSALATLAEARQHAADLAGPVVSAGVAVVGVHNNTLSDDSDPATLSTLQRGDTVGISQFETPAMRALLRQVRPQGLLDLMQCLAALRPAAALGGKGEFIRRRRGEEAVVYTHPCLEPVLRESYGVALFDDDVLGLVEAITALPPPDADHLRRQLCDRDTVGAAREEFVTLAGRMGIEKPAAESALAQVVRFERDSFCRAHAASYAAIAFQEAFYRANHPAAFWCAALNNHGGNYPRRVLVTAAQRAGLVVSLPNINQSALNWTQEVKGIRAGLTTIRGINNDEAKRLLEARQSGGPFTSFADFRRRVTLPDRDMAILIGCGAFDGFGRSRLALLREGEVRGMVPPPITAESEPWPFDGLEPGYPLVRQWRAEWDLLGFTSVPLMLLVRALVEPGLVDSRQLNSFLGQRVRLAGLLALCKEGWGDGGLVTLEDEWGLVEVYADNAADAEEMGPVLVVDGEVKERHGVSVLARAVLERPLAAGTAVVSALPRLRTAS